MPAAVREPERKGGGWEAAGDDRHPLKFMGMKLTEPLLTMSQGQTALWAGAWAAELGLSQMWTFQVTSGL